MNKLSILVGAILGLVFSIFVMGIGFKIAAPTMLLKEVKSSYEFDKTVELIKSRINKQDGWHVTNVINQQEEIINHGAADIGKVKIIKFCNAKYAAEMLSADESKIMATKMPLSISVYEKSDGRVIIGLSNGYVMARLFSGRREGVIMEKVIKDMEEVLSFTHFRFTLF
ncbi:periplasmic protein containing DUF302 [Sulfurimonas gotlandica GD1]|jgi:uncharacterized protein (DUF302 family)|uniref:Periplasmic protein containing DUF302 n=1 Tax=Sulfurimonas gotlandica (strain DSM 19862 / JCM 16533 / GD1) TaxID=929558 RepID=B6BI39_SULGG|nr:DUF302 domain-containing protein [Sulfurimonas gotlandica]EDZ63432.1 conserved domain protein [Sulfurimonas gotlandica GD1]EHP30192.1 periplasmic protein containing DUF302 [Sulfurimonas gotlandica GD1]